MKTMLAVLGLCCSTLAHAITVYLRAEDIEALDGAQTLVLNFAGIGTTITAVGGVTNRTRSGFGVNAPGGADDADAIDGDAGQEAISVEFSAQVKLLTIALSGFGRSDRAELVLDDRTLPVSEGGLAPLPLTPPLTQSLLLRHVAGNGFSLDRIEFEPLALEPVPLEPGAQQPTPTTSTPHTQAVAAPAPGAFALMLAGLGMLWAYRPGTSARVRNINGRWHNVNG